MEPSCGGKFITIYKYNSIICFNFVDSIFEIEKNNLVGSIVQSDDLSREIIHFENDQVDNIISIEICSIFCFK